MNPSTAQAAPAANRAAGGQEDPVSSQWPEAAGEDAAVLARILGAQAQGVTFDYNHALCAAVARFAPALGFKMRADPDRAGVLTPGAIARASGVRCRAIQLPENWWRQDLGPLLAFLRPAEKAGATVLDLHPTGNLSSNRCAPGTSAPGRHTSGSPSPGGAVLDKLARSGPGSDSPAQDISASDISASDNTASDNTASDSSASATSAPEVSAPEAGAAGAPVALLPSLWGGYRLFDPATGDDRRVDPELAARITSQAHCYHPLLPDGELSLKDLMNFGSGQALRDWAMVLFAGGVSALLALTLPYALAVVFSDLVPDGDRAHLPLVGVALLLAALAAFGMDYVSTLGHLRIGGRGSLQLTAALWDRVLRLPTEAVRAQGVGALTAGLATAESVREALARNAFNLATRGQQMLAALITLLVVAPGMAGVALLLAAGLAAVLWLSMRMQDRAFTEGRAIQGDVFNQPTEFLNALGKLRTAAAEERAFGRWAADYTEIRRRSVRAAGVNNRFLAFCAGYEVLAMGCAFWLVARPGGVLNEIGLSGTLVLMSALGVFLATLLPLAQGFGQIKVLQIQGKRLDPLLRARPLTDGRTDPGRLRGRVELDNVSVRYHPQGPLILRNVSLRAQPGEFIAIVGPSGGGKSTIVRALLGLLAPESGTVSYDGRDLQGLSRDVVRRQIGSVMQGGHLLPGTLLDNIVGPHDATLEEAWAAARMAAVDEDIAAMPMQMYTMVLDGASTFSGGQVQRILVARSLVSRPPIVIFDEATSALDGRAQAELVERMATLNCTRIVIAHRFSTVRRADRVYVVQQGVITEEGGVDELIAAGGYVAEVARRERLGAGAGEETGAGEGRGAEVGVEVGAAVGVKEGAKEGAKEGDEHDAEEDAKEGAEDESGAGESAAARSHADRREDASA